MSVHAFPNESGSSRLGLSVSKKVGNAVVRNGVRRRLREVFKASHAVAGNGKDLVVSARPGAGAAEFDALRAEFVLALRKLGAADRTHGE